MVKRRAARAGAAVLALGLIAQFLVHGGRSAESPGRARPAMFVVSLCIVGGAFGVGAMMGKGLGSIGGRWTFWRAAAQLIARRPVSGYGLGHFHASYPQGAAYLALPGGAPLTLPVSAHHDWIEYAVELGVFPAVLLLAVAVWAACAAWSRGRLPIALALGALVIQGAWDWSLHAAPVALLFFTLIGSVPAPPVLSGRRRRAARCEPGHAQPL